MQNNTFKLLSVVAGSAILLTACDGLGKMVKKQAEITHDVTPKPLEEKADSVAFTISGKYSKTFNTAYEPGMKVSKLEIRAKGAVKKKEKDFKGLEIADGTIITPL